MPIPLLFLLFLFNVLVLAAFVFELHEARKERKQLALLIKSADVQEFVRAETQLAAPGKPEPRVPDEPIDFDEAEPDEAIAALQGTKPPAA